MAGRDEDFKNRVKAGAVDLSRLKEGPPDPRNMPVTLTEITFRNTYHRFEPLLVEEDGTPKMLKFDFVIIDPNKQVIYKYGLAPDQIELLAEQIDMLKKIRDGEVELGGDVIPISKEFGGEVLGGDTD